ncbi:hypothetical protein BWZ20_11335 [Winogradskyella sp. J14-2]|uniref:transglutaminase domain-containing protein n=1 Tax=Winogradskyella sp. J14-2 TaxID=1936080 RepID=UPI00097280DA|nr:DUF3857 domain-containing protein [Winogradskyella sp. J14-2]APY08857.1 hypothetical protein BWZ20_11335 [Winogradskyella sp. J14-2]
MKKLLTLFLAVQLFQLNSYSQNFEFGKVTKPELQEKYHPTDSSASAAILYKSENIYFNYSQANGFRQIKEVVAKIKIYNKDGLNWANKKIPLYKSASGNIEKIKGIKGYTYNLENGKIEKSKLKNSGIFSENATDMFDISSFTLPNVKEGSIIEYEYSISSPFLQIDEINLQYTIPVNKIDVTAATPQFYRYKTRLNPRAFFRPTFTESKKNRQVSISRRGESTTRNTRVGSGSSLYNNQFEYYDNVIALTEVNVPALKAESFGGNINNYKAKLSLELEASLAKEGYVEKSYAVTWEGVSKSVYESENFGGQLNKSPFYKEELSAYLQNAEDDFHKAVMVENFVKSKVKWNGNYGIYAQKGIRGAYKDGTGNVADINLMVVAMLKSLGVEANPVLISTRNNGFPLFPTRQGFNYVICMVESQDGYMLIDATEPFSTNNILPERVLNWQGRLIKDGGVSRWVDVKTGKTSKKTIMLNVQIDNDLLISGKVREINTASLALQYRKRYTGLSEEDHLKSIESGKGDIEIDNLQYQNDTDISQPVKITYTYELSDGIDEIGDKLYFSPLLFLASDENPFKLEDRIYPIDFVYPVNQNTIVNILLPDGYDIEFLPESEALEFGSGDVKFAYIMQENGKYLSLKLDFEINNPFIAPKDYKNFKAFYSKIIDKNKEQIVLTKEK